MALYGRVVALSWTPPRGLTKPIFTYENRIASALSFRLVRLRDAMVRESVPNRSLLVVVGIAIVVAAPGSMAQFRPDRTIRLLIDEGHNNFHTSSGGYAGLTRL